ncbi:fimbrial protein [Hafnia alvei]|jgi:minor fimbrial subunit|uniref:fimbrial protein n=1 Tax=Hafnia alvei TaxID=569 RepID=UPI0014137573|nr:fimbrial protein [Hafnia alvei]QIP54476.1 type 1 fimbrial protein [Hafnia alvei]
MNFSMKKISAQVLLCLSIAAMSSHVMAADATINISGQVVSEGCSIAASSLNVVLPDIDANTLATTGSTSEYEPFKIDFTDCSRGIAQVAISYTATGGDNSDAGMDTYWANIGTAKNVNAEIRDTGTGGADKPAQPNSTGSIIDISPATNSASENFKVRIRNNGVGAATTGTVVVNFTMVFTYV